MKCRMKLERDERGFAMAGLLLVVMILAVVSSFSVVHTSLDTRSTAHYNTGNRAFYAAESGLMRALNSINGPKVIDFQADIVGRWAELLGSGAFGMPSDGQSGYSITVQADAANPRDRGVITAVGTGPLLARRTIRVTVGKSGFWGAPGTIHIAADGGVSSQFTGNAFEVDGNNHDRFGTLTGDGSQVPGISTRTGDIANSVASSLNNQQKDNVRGTGFSNSPLTPSVIPAGGPGVDDLDAFVADLLTNPSLFQTNTKKFNGNDTFGTLANPQVTYMTNANVTLNGNAQGAGILIADGSIKINGTLDFTGLMIVRGDTVINYTGSATDDTIVLGNATILGSLWTGNLQIKVGGSAIVDYCNECLQLVDEIQGQSGLIPRPMSILAWGEEI